MTFFAAADAATDPGLSISTIQLVLGALGTLGLGSVLAAMVSGFFSRRKLGADATEIITKAASGVVERIEADNERLREDLEREREERKAERDDFRRVVDEHTAVLQLHAAWDHMAVVKLQEAGIRDLPTPPPLYDPKNPPRVMRDL